MKRSKNYTAAAKKVDSTKIYTLDEALKVAMETSYTKFPASLDLVINFNVPSKHKNTVVRGSITLPFQTKDSETKVIVIAEGNDIKLAQAAGADEAGGDDLIKKIEGGFSDFDILIATPPMMVKIAKLGRILGPKGLMPNPKNETVTADVERVVKSYKAGKMDYKLDEQGSVKSKIGKINQPVEELKANFEIFFSEVYKETRVLGPGRLRSVYMSSTMGPSIKVEPGNLLKELA